ncbi:hypothetical protein K469DRAFT_791471 [Zopfia rhizophila CBS 207.26]|uniref:Uncharacterized protein n=1 Tax=Zopfia rhizophila CBS 207.26 TaxID=1314779 RepID=A0A6A6DUD9_9PEZI|nr:hypothetical protein K469DRAFT_791471 [Zopfia rhizophila CBS 207.26]
MSVFLLRLKADNGEITKFVKEGLLSEYEVIHIILTPTAGAADIPSILSGNAPPDHAANLGSQNYANPPVAVVTGGGYDDEAFNSMKDACRNVKAVPWVRPDKSKLKAMPPLGDEAFGKHTAECVKATLNQLGVGIEKNEDGVYLF